MDRTAGDIATTPDTDALPVSTRIRALIGRVTPEEHRRDAASWADAVLAVDRLYPEPREHGPLTLAERAWWWLTGWAGATARIREVKMAELAGEQRLDALQGAYRKWLSRRALGIIASSRNTGAVPALSSDLTMSLTAQRTRLRSQLCSADVMATTLILAILARCKFPDAVARAISDTYGTPGYWSAVDDMRAPSASPAPATLREVN